MPLRATVSKRMAGYMCR